MPACVREGSGGVGGGRLALRQRSGKAIVDRDNAVDIPGRFAAAALLGGSLLSRRHRPRAEGGDNDEPFREGAYLVPHLFIAFFFSSGSCCGSGEIRKSSPSDGLLLLLRGLVVFVV